MQPQKANPVLAPAYGGNDAEISALAEVVRILNTMKDDERLRIFRYLKDRYPKAWPSDTSF